MRKILSDTPFCLVCRIESNTVDRKVGEYTYYRCQRCTGTFVFPINSQDFYLENETYLDDMQLYVSRINPYGQRWILEQCERMYQEKFSALERGKYFEIGAGVGYMTLMALARGWEATGIETSKLAVDYAVNNLKVDLSLSTIEKFKPSGSYDLITLVEVLEHFLDPLNAFESIRKLCGESTMVFGTTPNTDSLHWQNSKQNIYEPEDHIFLFNETSIGYFAEKAGLKDLSVELFGSGENHDSNLMYSGIMNA